MNVWSGSGEDMDAETPTPADRHPGGNVDLVLDLETAERVLDARVDPADAPSAYIGVIGLLADASGPVTPGELWGEEDAVAMFRAAHALATASASPASTPSSAREISGDERPAPVISLDDHRKRRVSRRAVLVGIAVGLIVASTGVAAAGGDLPEPVQHVAHETLSRVGVSVPDAPPRPAPPAPPASGRPSGQPPTPSQTPATLNSTRPDRLDPQTTPPPTRPAPASPSSVPAPPTTSVPPAGSVSPESTDAASSLPSKRSPSSVTPRTVDPAADGSTASSSSIPSHPEGTRSGPTAS